MTEIVRATVGGLRGPGLTGDDRTFLTSKASEASLAAAKAMDSVAAVEPLLNTISDSLTLVVSERTTAGGFPANVFVKWAVGFEAGAELDAPIGTTIAGLVVPFAVSADTTKLEATLISRDRNDPDYDSAPGLAASDVTEWKIEQTPEEAGVIPGGAAAQIRWVPPRSLIPSASKSYFLVLTANDGDHYLGAQVTNYSDDLSRLRRGWYYFANGSNNFLDVGQAIGIKIETSKRVVRQPDFRLKSVATRIVSGGRTAYPFDNTTRHTFRTIMAVARGFHEVRVLFAAAGATPVSIARCAVAGVASAANYACAGVAWVPVTFDGLESAIIPPSPGATRRGWVASDWMPLTSIPRTDDPAARPLIAAAAYIDTAAALTLMGNADGTQSYADLAADVTSPVVFRHSAGDCVTTPADFVSAVNANTSPIVGFQYRANGLVKTIMNVGDSISAVDDNWSYRACKELSNQALAFESANVAWAGSGSNTFAAQFTDLASVGVYPDAAFVPVWTPNNFSGEITTGHVDDMRRWAKDALYALQAYNVRVLPWTGIPTNPEVHDYGATDSLRRSYNDEWRLIAGHGVTVPDMGAAMAGVIDADGQQHILVGATTDNIHPNNTGIEVMKGIAKAALPVCGLYPTGSLVNL